MAKREIMVLKIGQNPVKVLPIGETHVFHFWYAKLLDVPYSEQLHLVIGGHTLYVDSAA